MSEEKIVKLSGDKLRFFECIIGLLGQSDINLEWDFILARIDYKHGTIRIKESDKGLAIVLRFKPYIRADKSREIYLSISREEFYKLASSLFMIALALYKASKSKANKRKPKIRKVEGFENALK